MPIAKPTDISGCVLWLDPSDTDTVTTVTGAVSQITDKSGNSNTASQGTSTKRPAYAVDALTGRYKMGFDGGDTLEVADHATLDVTTGLSVFLAVNASTWGAYSYIVSKDTTADTAAFAIRTNATPTTLAGFVNGTSAQICASSSAAGRHIFGYTYNKTSIIGRRDRVTDGNVAYTTDIATNAKNLYIGAGRSAADFAYTGDIGEVVIYNKALTGVDLADIERYLYERWMVEQRKRSGPIRNRPAMFKP